MYYIRSTEPYPGLRPFKREEVDIFFGRDDHVNDIVEKLANNHFVCVTGPSGCGKSSLAKTGLMNALEAGFLPGAGSDWLFVDMRPGREPLHALVSALATSIINDSEHDLKQEELELMFKTHLESRSYDLNSAIALMENFSNRPVLLLIDQFEELFRFAQKDRHTAALFVEIILNTIQSKSNVYIVQTIRTEELENCSRYSGLTSAINSSQFLTPTLDRFQIQEAIEGPIQVFNGKIDPEFSVWLLNNVDQFLDKLPILQHTLKILYSRKLRELEKHKAENTTQTSKNDDTVKGITLSMSDFHEAFHTDEEIYKNLKEDRSLLRVSFSVELDRIYHQLPENLRHGTQRVFCELTHIHTKHGDIRRPRTVQQLADSIGLSTADTWKIIKHFIAQDVEYLYVRKDADNPDSSTVDVSHECILRLWDRLQQKWLVAEQKRADGIRTLATYANTYEGHRIERPIWSRIFGKGLLDSYMIQQYTELFGKEKPTEQWADRYLEDTSWQVENNHDGVKYDNKKKFSTINSLIVQSRRRNGVRIGMACAVGVLVVCWGAFEIFNAKENAIDEINLELRSARLDKKEIDKKISLIIDDVEKERPEGNSLYDPQTQPNADCLSDDTFCGRINLHSKAKFEQGSLQGIISKPLCQNTNFISNVAKLGSAIKPFCSFHPKTGKSVSAVPTEFVLREEAWRLMDSETKTSIATARSIFFGLAKKYPNEAVFFNDLGEAYKQDAYIAKERRFSESNACKARELKLMCEQKYTAFLLYKWVNAYSNNFLIGTHSDGSFYVLNKDIITLKIMMMAEFLDEATINDDVLEVSVERVSRLWRGIDSASDVARALYKSYECTKNTNLSQCKIANQLYEKAAQALSVLLELSKQTTNETPIELRKQVAYGMGLSSLHWTQDSNFRKIAELSISQDDMISELEKAYLVTKTPRYPAGLAMLYCLNDDLGKAEEKANAIRSENPKYEYIKGKVETCANANNLEIHFDRANPSE